MEILAMKIKGMPSLREKRRYITFRVDSEAPVTYAGMKDAVMASVLGWLGENGLSSANPRIIRNLWSDEKRLGWISCSHRSVDGIIMSLALVRQIGQKRVSISVLGVSGTISSGKKKIMGAG